MPAPPSRRLGLHAPAGGDPADVPDDQGRLRDQLDGQVVVYDQGTLASRPGTGVEGRMYYATDDGTLYYDTGVGWVPAAWQPGDVRLSAANAAPPPGWLTAAGSLVSQTTFAALFAAIGHAFNNGVEPAAGMFRLPDLQGRVPIGAGAGAGLTARMLGTTGGTETHKLTVAEMPTHAHSFDRPSSYGVSPGSANGVQMLGTNWSSNNTGGDRPHPNMQPYLTLNAWIKT